MRTIKKKSKRYDVNWIRNGFCYRTTTDCPWDAVLEAKRTAKLMGEAIEYEFTHYHEETYTLPGHRGGSPFFMCR